jgi:hypothetical protein
MDAEDYYQPRDLLHRAYGEWVITTTQMGLEPNIFDLARLERALVTIDRKVSRVLEVIEKYEEEDEDYP